MRRSVYITLIVIFVLGVVFAALLNQRCNNITCPEDSSAREVRATTEYDITGFADPKIILAQSKPSQSVVPSGLAHDQKVSLSVFGIHQPRKVSSLLRLEEKEPTDYAFTITGQPKSACRLKAKLSLCQQTAATTSICFFFPDSGKIFGFVSCDPAHGYITVQADANIHRVRVIPKEVIARTKE